MNFSEKTYYIAGIANKKSVACFIAKDLKSRGANLILSAQNEQNLAQIKKIFPEDPSFIYDVESPASQLKSLIQQHTNQLHGMVHSIAFAKFSTPSFLETPREDFLQAVQISAFSFVEMANALKELFTSNASLLTISISNTKATSYGYLGPIKAMLNAITGYMAKSFSEFSEIRVNAIGAGPLKTSASAGIPDYLDNYLFAEALTLRKRALSTQEVSNTALYLLSDYSTGMNGEILTLDAGMNLNYFDQDLVKTYTKNKF